MRDDAYFSEMVKRGPLGRISLMWEVRKFDFFTFIGSIVFLVFFLGAFIRSVLGTH